MDTKEFQKKYSMDSFYLKNRYDDENSFFELEILDSPILDLITFYQKEYMNFDFNTLINKYLHNYPLKENELNLFYIVISIPPIIALDGKEIEATKKMREKLDYVFKTENLITKMTNDGDK